MKAITFIWLIVLAGIAVVEYVAIKDPVVGDTLSEHWWWLRDNSLPIRIMLFGGWSWLTWHFLFGRPGWYGWQDIVAILVGMLLAVGYPRSE